MIEILKSGRWYEWLAGFGVVDGSEDPDSIKIEAQKQMLFARDWRVESRPLWSAVTGELPGFGKLIEFTRSRQGSLTIFPVWKAK
ncbi:hypothetical protein [Neorhodopirellula pilleata]|uniref:hypothetical protein n=1 Tax=Neorhodopirellula pilleata TaxID=2714738 RepID=UPI001E4F1287|nr:hypothetical protein [Neorhodopirellula pilleata]